MKSWIIGKDPDAGKDEGQQEKGKTEDKMVGWHHDSKEIMFIGNNFPLGKYQNLS